MRLQGFVGLGSGSHGGLPLTIIAGGVVPARFVPCLLYVDVVGTAWNVVADKTVNDVVCHPPSMRGQAKPSSLLAGPNSLCNVDQQLFGQGFVGFLW